MSHTIRVSPSDSDPLLWRVLLDDKEIVSFAGQNAHELAEQNGRDLASYFQAASIHKPDSENQETR